VVSWLVDISSWVTGRCNAKGLRGVNAGEKQRKLELGAIYAYSMVWYGYSTA